jgi:hypothetical protein
MKNILIEKQFELLPQVDIMKIQLDFEIIEQIELFELQHIEIDFTIVEVQIEY